MRLKLLAAALAAGLGGPALAQDAGMYVGGSLGRSKVELDTQAASAALTGLGITHTSFSEDEKDTAWKVYFGYRFNRSLAIEAGYVDVGEFSASTTVTAVNGVAVPPTPVTSTIKTKNGIFVAGLAGVPLGSFSIFGKLGLYSMNVKATASAGGESFANGDTDGDFLFGLGAQYDIARNFGIRAEWERFRDVGSEQETGEGDVDMVSVGLVYRF